MTNMQAIVAGTKISAEALGMEKDIGTLEKNKLADIIAVKDDPNKNITKSLRSKEEAHEKLAILKKEMFGHHDKKDGEHDKKKVRALREKYAAMEKEIIAAARAGKITREEAGKEIAALKEKMFGYLIWAWITGRKAEIHSGMKWGKNIQNNL